MAPKADGNVPFLPGKRRVLVVNVEPTWHIQKFGNGVNATGVAPVNGPTPVVPTLGPQEVLWSGLTDGGLFDFMGLVQPAVIDSIYAIGATPTVSIVGVSGAVRPAPAAFPYKLAVGEKLKITLAGASGTPEVGVQIRVDGDRIL